MERKIQMIKFSSNEKINLKKVAAYARVSSGKDAMLHSLTAQIVYYSQYIQSHNDWAYCGVYFDEAVSGTKNNRENFQQLIEDCRNGKIDMIITKSISRFARNTVVLLEVVRELKLLGVDVYFEEQNIHTLSNEGEFTLTILASFAEEEARSVSENQKWRIKKNFEEGKPWNTVILGYKYMDGKFIVEPKEADIVKSIFKWYLDGCGSLTIVKKLNEQNILTRNKNAWSKSSVMAVLRNYTYTGNLLLQKTYRKDHLSKCKLINDGVLSKYHASNTHQAIIPIDEFNIVQDEIKKRSEKFASKRKTKNTYPFSSLIVCERCGKKYRRKLRKTSAEWVCSTYNSLGKKYCASKAIPETTLQKITEKINISNIEKIIMKKNNELLFNFKNGSQELHKWYEK